MNRPGAIVAVMLAAWVSMPMQAQSADDQQAIRALMAQTTMSGVVSPAGEVQPPHTELSIRVAVKDGGTWKVTAFHNVIVQR